MRMMLSSLFLILALSLIAASKESAELRVATFNVRYDSGGDRGPRDWKARRGLVIQTIKEMSPDILGLQEALEGQLLDLRKALPKYAMVGVAREDGKREGEYSPIFYLRDRFEIDPKERGTFWLSDSPEKPGSITWDNVCPRVCSWARLIDRTTGKGLYFYNTHLDHKGRQSRVKSAALILEKMAARRHLDEPCLLTGDLNARETSPELTLLLGSKKVPLRNSFLLARPDELEKATLNGWDHRRREGAMIDYILVSASLGVESAQIVRTHREGQVPSDHFPVLAVCRWSFTAKKSSLER